MGLRYGIDYFTQVAGKGNTEERLIADIVILIPNSGKKDVLIIDSKSSTKLGSSTSEFMASVESSINTFARKDYKSAVEKRVKEFLPNVEINHTHLFIYLPFDRMLSRISEEKPELLKKVREKDVGILTPVILDFLLDTIKLYSAKIELNERAEEMMEEVKELIKRTGVVLEFVKDLGKSIDLSAKKYQALKASVQGRFVPIVNRMAKPLNVKQVIFDDLNEEGLKQIETKD
jgi:DNA anti-recombination protein RmuC